MAGYDKVIEQVPELFTRRQGDWVAEGANNAIVILGTDRVKPDGPATGRDGLGTRPGAGSIAVIAGRHDPKGHPNINDDDATLYLSMKTDVDVNVHSDKLTLGRDGVVPNVKEPGSAAVLTSKDVRIACDADGSVKVFLSQDTRDKYVFINGDQCEIHLGSSFINLKDGVTTINSSQTEIVIDRDGNIKLGELAARMNQLIQIFANIGIVSQTGNLGAPVPINPDLVRKLLEWSASNISGDKFIKMDKP